MAKKYGCSIFSFLYSIRGVSKIFCDKVVGFVGSVASFACGPWGSLCAAGWSYEFTRAMGGSSYQALKGAFTAGATAFVFQQIGAHYKGVSAKAAGTDLYRFGGNYLTSGRVASHAFVGGVSSVLQGGKFGHGFFAAGVTKGFGGAWLPDGSDLEFSQIVRGTVVSAIIGGTASVISGGKFANGARTSAFQYLFNQAQNTLARSKYTKAEKGVIRLAEQLAMEAANEIDATNVVLDTLESWGLTGALYNMVRGTLIHQRFSELVNEAGVPLFIGEKYSYLLGEIMPWGFLGTSRPDAIFGFPNQLNLFFELKTGVTLMTPTEGALYRLNSPGCTRLIELYPLYNN